eukprot:403346655
MKDIPKEGKITLCQWNINGINAILNKGALQIYMDEMKPQIVCLNEVKTSHERLNETGLHMKLPTNYEQYWNCSTIKKGIAGTGLLTQIKPEKVLFGIGIEKHDVQGRVLTAEFKHFVLINTYTPNAGMFFERIDYRVDEWDVDFRDYLDHVRDTYKKPIILTGDFNEAFCAYDIFERPQKKLKHPLQGFHPKEYDSMKLLFDRGYIDSFRHLYPTTRELTNFSYRSKNPRERNHGCRLDYFIVSKDHFDMVIDSKIHKRFLGSDHVPIELEIDAAKLRKISKVKVKQEKFKEPSLSKIQKLNNQEVLSGGKRREKKELSKKKLKNLDLEQTKKLNVKENLLDLAVKVFNIKEQSKFSGLAEFQGILELQKSLKIWAWNINGLRSITRKRALSQFIESADPLILCLSEIKIDQQALNKSGEDFQLPTNYEQYWNCSITKKGYAGTGLLTRIKPLKVSFGMGIEKHDEHGRIITAEYEHFVIVNAYFPNGGFQFEKIDYRRDEWDLDFNSFLDYIRDSTNKPVILAGDLNIGRDQYDLYEGSTLLNRIPKYLLKQENSLTRLLNKGYIDSFRELYPYKRDFTIYSSLVPNSRQLNKGKRTDYFIVTKDHFDMVIDNKMHKQYEGSDHVPIELEIDTKKLLAYQNIK